VSTIIDHLIIELDLDPKAFDAGKKKAAEAFLLMSNFAEESSKKTEGAMDKASNKIADLSDKALKFFAAWKTVQTAVDVGANITKANMAIGNMAKVTGDSVRNISLLQGVFERAGGSAQGVSGAILGIDKELKNFAVGKGAPSLMGVIKALNDAGAGINVMDRNGNLKAATQLLLEIADARDRLNIPNSNYVGLLRTLGFDEPTVAVMLKGGKIIRGMIEDQKEISVVMDKDVEASDRLTAAWYRMEQAAEQLARRLVKDLEPAITKTLNSADGKGTTPEQVISGVNSGGYSGMFSPGGLYGGTPGAQRDNPNRTRTGGRPGTVPQRRSDATGTGPASIRYNNPGAQYPNADAQNFGGSGYGVIGGGHLIQRFNDPVGGAASNMNLFANKYVGLPIGAAGAKWTGNNAFGVPGFDPTKVVTTDMVKDPKFMIPFMKAIARREAGRDFPMTDDQWSSAFKQYQEKVNLDKIKSLNLQGRIVKEGTPQIPKNDVWKEGSSSINVPWLSNPRLIRAPRYNSTLSSTNNYSTSETTVHSLIINGSGKPTTDDAFGIGVDAVPSLQRGEKVNQAMDGPH
jgi:hypothetical protein